MSGYVRGLVIIEMHLKVLQPPESFFNAYRDSDYAQSSIEPESLGNPSSWVELSLNLFHMM